MKLLHSTYQTKKRQYITSIATVLLITMACFFEKDIIGYKVVALVLLMTVSVLAMIFDILPVMIASVLSALIWNFFFIPPLFTFHIDNAEDVLMFFLYFVIALVNAVLTFKIREAENKARDKEEKENTIKLYNTLLNSLSHELRTPISTIIGAVDTLKVSGDKLSANQQIQLLTQIDVAGVRLNTQVENLLNMSRLETGLLTLKLQWCDINELINTVIQKSDNFITDKQIVFIPDETLPICKIDSGIIEQVLENIISNATQYTPPKTIIKIEASVNNNHLNIIISDNGNGIDKELLSQIFHKFYRIANNKTGGIGLGLSISKGFVEAHKGAITAKNMVPQGLSFIIELPVEVSYIKSLKNE